MILMPDQIHFQESSLFHTLIKYKQMLTTHASCALLVSHRSCNKLAGDRQIISYIERFPCKLHGNTSRVLISGLS